MSECPSSAITAGLPELPSFDVISKSQRASPPPPDAGCSLTSNLGTDIWMTKNGKIYIPEKDDELQLRICVAVHCGFGGHRGHTATTKIVKENLHWSTMEADIKAFVQSCLVCNPLVKWFQVPRPLGQQIQCSARV